MRTKRQGYRGMLMIAGQEIPRGIRADFNQRRTVEKFDAGGRAQYKAEGQRAKFTKKRK